MSELAMGLGADSNGFIDNAAILAGLSSWVSAGGMVGRGIR